MNAQRRHIQTDRRTDTPIDQTMPFYCMCPETFKKKRLTQIFRNQKQDKNVEIKTKNGKADETHNEVKIYEKDLQFKTKPIPLPSTSPPAVLQSRGALSLAVGLQFTL